MGNTLAKFRSETSTGKKSHFYSISTTIGVFTYQKSSSRTCLHLEIGHISNFFVCSPTIETCFNCFGTRSSDAKKIKKTTKPPEKFISYATSLDPPPPRGGRGGVSNMAPVPEGEDFFYE